MTSGWWLLLASLPNEVCMRDARQMATFAEAGVSEAV